MGRKLDWFAASRNVMIFLKPIYQMGRVNSNDSIRWFWANSYPPFPHPRYLYENRFGLLRLMYIEGNAYIPIKTKRQIYGNIRITRKGWRFFFLVSKHEPFSRANYMCIKMTLYVICDIFRCAICCVLINGVTSQMIKLK